MKWIKKYWAWFLGRDGYQTPSEDPEFRAAFNSVVSAMERNLEKQQDRVSGDRFETQCEKERDFLAEWFSRRLRLITVDCLVESYEYVLTCDITVEDDAEDVVHMPAYYFHKAVLTGVQKAIDRGDNVPLHLTGDAVWELWMNGEYTYRWYCELYAESAPRAPHFLVVRDNASRPKNVPSLTNIVGVFGDLESAREECEQIFYEDKQAPADACGFKWTAGESADGIPTEYLKDSRGDQFGLAVYQYEDGEEVDFSS